MTSFQNIFSSAIKKKQQSVQAKKLEYTTIYLLHSLFSYFLSFDYFFIFGPFVFLYLLILFLLFACHGNAFHSILFYFFVSSFLSPCTFLHLIHFFLSLFHIFDTHQYSLFCSLFSYSHNTRAHELATKGTHPHPSTHALFCGLTHSLLSEGMESSVEKLLL